MATRYGRCAHTFSIAGTVCYWLWSMVLSLAFSTLCHQVAVEAWRWQHMQAPTLQGARFHPLQELAQKDIGGRFALGLDMCD